MRKLKIILLLTLSLELVAWSLGYALDLTKVKVNFLKGDYKAAIIEGEKTIAQASAHSYGLDELYYILALSYLKDGNYLRACDIFEIILKEFKNGSFKEEALLGLGDVYFTKGDYTKAKEYYRALTQNTRSKLKPIADYKLAQCALKTGERAEAQDYLAKVKQQAPLNIEAQLNKDLEITPQIYYTVQVGAFSRPANARNLTQKLITQGYPAYTQQLNSSYRVRAGKFQSLKEAQDLQAKLSKEGYPTKIFP